MKVNLTKLIIAAGFVALLAGCGSKSEPAENLKRPDPSTIPGAAPMKR